MNSFFGKKLPKVTRGFRLGFKIEPCLAFACHQGIKIPKTEGSPDHHWELEGAALRSSDNQFQILQPNLGVTFFHLNPTELKNIRWCKRQTKKLMIEYWARRVLTAEKVGTLQGM